MASAARRSRGSVSHHAGLAAERIILKHYEQRGTVLVRDRWRGKRGEIDLILRDGSTLIFVEVKQSHSFERAACRVTARQKQRIYGAAEEFLALTPGGSLTDTRFDVALVDQAGAVQIIENAIGLD